MIIFPWPSSALSPNARGHWAVKASATKAARQLAFYATKESKHPPAMQFRVMFHPPSRRGFDLDGLVSRCKPYFDGMADAWKVNDRDFRWTAEIGEIVPGGRVIVEPEEGWQSIGQIARRMAGGA